MKHPTPQPKFNWVCEDCGMRGRYAAPSWAEAAKRVHTGGSPFKSWQRCGGRLRITSEVGKVGL